MSNSEEGAGDAPPKIVFEWDEAKAKANIRKHQISFEEARTVFWDPFSLTIPDPEHSFGEQRYLDLGRSSRDRILAVSYTERGATIRLISCRRATRAEQRTYEEGDR